MFAVGYQPLQAQPLLSSPEHTSSGAWHSSILYKGEDSALVYHADEAFNRIPDFSHAGYKGGGVSLPNLPVRITLRPSSGGDDTRQIQEALDWLGSTEPDQNGHRGAVLLEAGTYRITSQLTIRHSGVVLRGVGDGTHPDTNTILYVDKNAGEQAIQVGTGHVTWNTAAETPLSEIITDFVAVGNRHFEITDASRFEVGDDIIIMHPSTEAWVEAVEHGGQPATERNPWVPIEPNLNIMKLRTITGISGNVIAVDVPVFNHLNRAYSRSFIYRPDFAERIYESGVEHLRLVLESNAPDADDHVANGVIFDGVKNSWAYGITVLHFRHQGIGVARSSFVTVQNARSLDPHSPLIGARRYNFNVTAHTTNILFTDVHATEGRHCYISNGTASATGIVFHNGTSKGAHATTEGHRRWSSGLLFDQLTFSETSRVLLVGLYNRGSWGTRHGWSAAHSVAWNLDVGERGHIVIQQPPTAQNYGIGNRGVVNGDGPWPGEAGFIEGTGQVPALPSLYEAQLSDRLTFGIAPDMPTHLTASSHETGTGITLDWQHLSLDDITIVIQRATGDGSFRELARISSAETSYQDQTAAGVSYRYRIAAVDNGRMSAWSNVAFAN